MKRSISVPFAAMAAAALWFLLPGSAAQAINASTPAPAGTPTAEQKAEAILNSLHPKTGKITLPGGIADLNVTGKFAYLDAGDAKKVLVDLWENPPAQAEGLLGMLIPEHFGDDAEHVWGVCITYNESGYVKDEDADKMNYDDLLKQLQKSQEDDNSERVKQGYDALHLVGWAQQPRYDKSTKKFYWAMDYQVGDGPLHSLNYDIRILGRKGVLVLEAIAPLRRLDTINNAVPEILTMVNFNAGSRYADFNPATDKMAAYGLAGLIGVGVLAKAGIFKVILGALAAGWKLVAVGLAAVGAFFKRIFGGGTKVNTDRPGPPTGVA